MKWKRILCSLPLLAGLAVATVTQHGELTVARGHTVYLHPQDLIFDPAPGLDEPCKIEVVHKEPMTQMVGELEPQVSDCKFHTLCQFLSTEDR